MSDSVNMEKIEKLYQVLRKAEWQNCKFQSIGASIPELAVHLF